MMNRRGFCLLSACSLPGMMFAAETPPSAGRALVFQISKGFGDASPDDIRAVLHSAAETIWEHCPNTRWEVPGFEIYPSKDAPITDYAHSSDGSIAIGLTVQGRQWAQFAFQFAHEFCHALAGHANDWKKPWTRGRKANHWLEETLAETASLFALRAISRGWETKPPYPNWKGYAPALADYARDRMEGAAKALPAGMAFESWFRENEPSLRKDAVQRDKNLLMASRLLPLFEETPSGWEAVTFINLVPQVPENPLAGHFHAWQQAAPEAQCAFIGKLGKVFGVG